MQVEVRLRAVREVLGRNFRPQLCAAICCGVVVATVPALAYGSNAGSEGGIDLHMVADLEQRASVANPKERAFLYADLADKMTMLASRQISEGEIEEAGATLDKMEECTSKMESSFQQSKSLKKTELLLHTTSRRLTDLLRASSYEVKPKIQEAIRRLNAAQASLLAAIFAR